MVRTIYGQAAVDLLGHGIGAAQKVAKGMPHDPGSALQGVYVQGWLDAGSIEIDQGRVELRFRGPIQKRLREQPGTHAAHRTEARAPLGKSKKFFLCGEAALTIGAEQRQ
jgi:hypothetical protein